MNNIERFKSGDKRLQIIVKDMSDEQKILVQRGFFALGWSWNGCQSESIYYLGKHLYSNCYYKDANASKGQLVQSTGVNDDNYPTTSFTELMILANMESLPEVVPFLDENELKKYNIKQEGNMKSNEFTKDMLKDGMFVLMRDNIGAYEWSWSGAYWIKLGDKLISEGGFMRLDEYKQDLTFPSDTSFDIVEVFTSESLTGLTKTRFEQQLTSIWKRQSPEEEQRLSEKAALQEDIHAMRERLKSMESKLESM